MLGAVEDFPYVYAACFCYQAFMGGYYEILKMLLPKLKDFKLGHVEFATLFNYENNLMDNLLGSAFFFCVFYACVKLKLNARHVWIIWDS